MATTSIETQPKLAPIIAECLGALRGRIRRYVWLEGLTCGIAWLGVAFWASLVIDWFFEPPPVVRVAIFAVAALVLGGVLLKLIALRALVSLSNSNMATLLERRFGQLDDTLLTAVELTDRAPDPAQCNRQMLARTCNQAAERIGEVRLRGVFNPVPLRKSVCAAVLLAVTVGMFAYQFPEAFGTWAQRNLLFSPELWPRKSLLDVEGFEDGVEKVARGADFEVIALADKTAEVVPKKVYVRYRIEGGSRGREPMDRLDDTHRFNHSGPKFRRFSYTFQGVLADVNFDLVGGDARVKGLRIKVVDSPTLDEITLHCNYPQYMDRAAEPVPVTGTMQIPLGTIVTVHATANKDLLRVQIDSRRSEHPLPQEVLEDLADDPRNFRHTLQPLGEGTTRVRYTLSDTDEITSRRPFQLDLAAIPDEKPQFEKVRLDGIGQAITPQAILPAVGRVTDDHGIAEICFQYAVGRKKPKEQEEQKERRKEEPKKQEEQAEQEAPEEPATVAIPYPPTDTSDVEFDPRKFELRASEAVMDLRKLQSERDLELQPGQTLKLCIQAADRLGWPAGDAYKFFPKGPNVGESPSWELDLVTPAELRKLLNWRELMAQQRFKSIIRKTTETRDRLLRIDFTVPDTGQKAGEEESEPPSERRSRQVQQAIQDGHQSASETLGVADEFNVIRKQFANNRIITDELEDRLQKGIVDPLRNIAEEMFPELARRLQRLQANVADNEAGPEQRDLAHQQADAILFEMHKVLDRMLKLEDFNEVIQLLQEIIKEQQALRKQTDERHKQKPRELLED